MRLPTRYDLSTHYGGAQLLWNDAAGDAEDAQWEFLDVMCFNHVLTTTDGSEVAPYAFCVLYRQGNEPADDCIMHIFVKYVALKKETGPRKQDKKPKLGGLCVIENLEEIRSVRWATEEEMNTLAADFLEKPKHGKLGDLYIPPEHKHDAFEYFSKMREL